MKLLKQLKTLAAIFKLIIKIEFKYVALTLILLIHRKRLPVTFNKKENYLEIEQLCLFGRKTMPSKGRSLGSKVTPINRSNLHHKALHHVMVTTSRHHVTNPES